MVSASAGLRLARKVRAGEDLAPGQYGRPLGCGDLGPHREVLREMVEANADITMPGLARVLEDATGVEVAPAPLSRALRRWVRRRLPWMRAEPHRLVSVDETYVRNDLTRLRGRAPVGERLRVDAPFGR